MADEGRKKVGQSFSLYEDQIPFLREEAKRTGHANPSALLRQVIDDLKQKSIPPMIVTNTTQPEEGTADATVEGMTVFEAAEKLNISENSVRVALRKKRLKGRKSGPKTWIIDPASVEGYEVTGEWKKKA